LWNRATSRAQGLGTAPRPGSVWRAAVVVSRPVPALETPRPDCRRFLCDACRRAVYLCSACDRGQRYCSTECRSRARREGQRGAGRRYQRTLRGRRMHARRQARYRARQQAAAEKVTHHRCPPEARAATVAACASHTSSASIGPAAPSVPPSSSRFILCHQCSAPCVPLVRHVFFHRRRR